MKLARAVLFAILALAFASPARALPIVPEIDPGIAPSALTVLGGAVLMLKGRRRK